MKFKKVIFGVSALLMLFLLGYILWDKNRKSIDELKDSIENLENRTDTLEMRVEKLEKENLMLKRQSSDQEWSIEEIDGRVHDIEDVLDNY